MAPQTSVLIKELLQRLGVTVVDWYSYHDHDANHDHDHNHDGGGGGGGCGDGVCDDDEDEDDDSGGDASDNFSQDREGYGKVGRTSLGTFARL